MSNSSLILIRDQDKLLKHDFRHSATAEDLFRSTLNSVVFSSYSGYNLSEKPLYSAGYSNRVGLVLMGDGLAGLTYNTSNPCSQLNIDGRRLYSTIKVNFEGNLAAILVAGNTEESRSIEQFLKEVEVPIIGKYLDNWDHLDSEKLIKDILVIPKKKKVILRVRSKGYMSLTP